jgi:hypothetical protein
MFDCRFQYKHQQWAHIATTCPSLMNATYISTVVLLGFQQQQEATGHLIVPWRSEEHVINFIFYSRIE